MAFGGDIRRVSTVITARDEASDEYQQLRQISRRLTGDIALATIANRKLAAAFAASLAPTIALTAALAAIAGTQATVAHEFRNLRTLTGLTNEEFRQLRVTADNLTSTFGLTMDEVEVLSRQLSFAGIEAGETQQTLDALEDTAKLVSAAAGENKEVIEALTNAYAAFDRTAAEAEQSAQLFAAAADNGNTTVKQLAKGVNEVSDAARLAGVSLEETTGLISVLNSEGQDAQEAAQGLSTIFNTLQNPTEKVSQKFAELGVNVNNFTTKSGRLERSSELVARLNEAFGDLSGFKQLQALETAFGDAAFEAQELVNSVNDTSEALGEQYRTALREVITQTDKLNFKDIIKTLGKYDQKVKNTGEVTNELASKFGINRRVAAALAEEYTSAKVSAKGLAKQVRNAATAVELAEKNTETLVGALDRLVGAFSRLANQMFAGGMNDQLTAFFNKFATGVAKISKSEKIMSRLGAVMVPVTAALLTFTVAVGSFLLVAAVIKPTISSALAGIEILSGGAIQASNALQLVRSGWMKFIRIAGNVVFWLYILYNGVKQGLGLLQALTESTGQLQRIFKALKIVLVLVFDLLVAAAEGLGIMLGVIAKLAAIPLAPIFAALISVLDVLATFIIDVAEDLKAFSEVAQEIIDVLGFLIAIIVAVAAVASGFGPAVAVVSSVFITFGSAIATVVSVLGSLATGITFVLGTLSGLATAIGSLSGLLVVLKLVFIGVAGTIVGALGPVITSILVGVTVVSALVGVFLLFTDIDIVGILAGIGSALLDALVAPFKQGIDLILKAFRSLAADNYGKALVQAFMGGLRFIPVISAIIAALDFIRSLLPGSNAERGPLSDIMGSGAAIIKALLDGLVGNGGIVASALSAVLSGIQPIIFGYIGLWKTAIGTVLNVFSSVFSAIAGVVQPFIESSKVLTAIVKLVLGAFAKYIAIVRSVIATISDALGPFAKIAGAILSIIFPVIGLAGAIGYLLTNFDSISGVVSAAQAAIQTALTRIKSVVTAVFGLFLANLRAVANFILNDAIGPILTIGETILKLMFPILGVVDAIRILMGRFDSLSDITLAAIGQALRDAFIPSDLIPQAVQLLTGFVDLVNGMAQRAIALLTQTKIGQAIVDAFTSGLSASPIVSAIMDIVSMIAAFLPSSNADRGPLSDIMGTGGAIIDALLDGLLGEGEKLRAAIDRVLSLVGDAIFGYMNLWKSVFTVLVNGWIGIINKLIGAMNKIPGVDLPTVPQVQTGDGGGGGGGDGSNGPSSPGGTGQGQGQGITVEINQTLDIGDNQSPEQVQQAAEQGATNAVNATIKELERLLNQEMGGTNG